MKPYPQGSSTDSAKTTAGQPAMETPGFTAAGWDKDGTKGTDCRVKSPQQAAPVWTRYIDSRLKQFCTR